MFDFYAWWDRHYQDMRGNLKTAAFIAGLSGMTTAFHFLVSGMPLWRHILIDLLFSILALWLAILLWEHRPNRTQKLTVATLSDSPKAPPLNGIELFDPLQIQAVQLAHRLKSLLQEVGPCPDIKQADFPQTAQGRADRMVALMDVRAPWCDRVTALYAIRCKDDVEKLYYALLAERDIKEGVLLFQVQGMNGYQSIAAKHAKLWEIVVKLGGLDEAA